MQDGWYRKVRIGKRRVRVRVLVTMGVRKEGERVMVDMRLDGDESTAAWSDVVQQLQARNVGTPALDDHRWQSGLGHARCEKRGPRCRSSDARRTSCAI